MRWIAAVGWAIVGLWLILARYVPAEFRDTGFLIIGVICVATAALIAIGGPVGRFAAGYGMGVAALVAVGCVVILGSAGSGAGLGAGLYMAALSAISYQAAKKSRPAPESG